MDLINKVLLDANLIVIQSSFEHITLVVMLKNCQIDSFIKNETVQGFLFLGIFLIFNFPTMHL